MSMNISDQNECLLFQDLFLHSPIKCEDVWDFLNDETMELPWNVDGEDEEFFSLDQLLSESVIDVPSNQSISSPIDVKASLSFINPPEPVYHVRYLSEITPTTKSKKHVSGRYLRGVHGRHVTIELPSILNDCTNLYVRVTRLTVPYHDQSFIHPYPLVYSNMKKRYASEMIIEGSSIYYKVNKEDLCSCLKQIPYLILARLKQCHLKQISHLHSFDQKQIVYPFIGNNVKSKIATYQLKKSQLDFRLVVREEQTGEFLETNIFCRSEPLLEEEGIEYQKASRRKSSTVNML